MYKLGVLLEDGSNSPSSCTCFSLKGVIKRLYNYWIESTLLGYAMEGYWMPFLPYEEDLRRKRRNSMWCFSGQAHKHQKKENYTSGHGNKRHDIKELLLSP
ncbi:hypothetical protein AVEN_108209-1 [Araneus ventricosus]|uniref:Uncharacterized protein n=1 Tax=Araneus ventricosus TaxID=182803 RepID=A0A4Y2I354_ARAVE|nr:hypothetical protein AVEN_108209-1 [Araneus ventricosus]